MNTTQITNRDCMFFMDLSDEEWDALPRKVQQRIRALYANIIEETATYYMKARSARAAERYFLNHIAVNAPGITCEVNEREVYKDPENRELNLPQKEAQP